MSEEELNDLDLDEDQDLASEVRESLEQTEREAEELEAHDPQAHIHESWKNARLIIEHFKPTPYLIWRYSHFVIGTAGVIRTLREDLLFSLRKILLETASDPVLGAGYPIATDREAIDNVKPDVFVAAAILYSSCRRLKMFKFQRIWRPILEEALLRSRLGFHIAAESGESFGSGRGMLAGFASRIGLVVQIATGDLKQARASLDRLARGEPVQKIGLELYGSEPLQVSSMLLVASGASRDAAYSVAGMPIDYLRTPEDRESFTRWQAVLSMIESFRFSKVDQILDEEWGLLFVKDELARQAIIDEIQLASRRGHGWDWMLD